MEFFELVEARHSVRRYLPEPVEAREIEAILSAARLAPSAGDLQAYAVVIVESDATKAVLAAAALGQDFVAEAPVVLVFLADAERSAEKYGRRGATLFCLQDASIAAAYAQLAATALGLCSCWVGAFDEAPVARALRAPPNLRPIVLMPVGHPGESPSRPPRRPLAELVRREKL